MSESVSIVLWNEKWSENGFRRTFFLSEQPEDCSVAGRLTARSLLETSRYCRQLCCCTQYRTSRKATSEIGEDPISLTPTLHSHQEAVVTDQHVLPRGRLPQPMWSLGTQALCGRAMYPFQDSERKACRMLVHGDDRNGEQQGAMPRLQVLRVPGQHLEAVGTDQPWWVGKDPDQTEGEAEFPEAEAGLDNAPSVRSVRGTFPRTYEWARLRRSR